MYMCIRTARTAPVLFRTFNNFFLISRTSHFVKVTLHDFTALHVKFGLLCRSESTPLEKDGMWDNNRFISIIVFSQSLEAKFDSILINRTALMYVFLYVKFYSLTNKQGPAAPDNVLP